MAQLTDWLKLMVAEIHRKQEEAERSTQEEAIRVKERDLPSADSSEGNGPQGRARYEKS